MENEDKISKIELTGMLGNTFLAGVGEISQVLVREGHMDYNWVVGHLSDYAAIGALTSYYLLFAKRTKTKILATLTSPMVYSVAEVVFPLIRDDAKCDLQDIVCYFGGALTALGIKELSSWQRSKKLGKLEKITTNP